MLKVCHMTSVHKTTDGRIFIKECSSLAKAGYEVYLVGRGESREENGVLVVGVGEPTGGRLSRMTKFKKRVYKAALALDADIYHFHDPELLSCGVKLKKKGKKVIFDSHEKYTEQLKDKPYLPKFITRMIAKWYGAYEKKVLKKIDAVIFPCTMGGINPFAGLCKRTPIISNAAILEELYDRYDEHYPKRPNTLCYVGGLTNARGITASVEAAYRSGATLVLAGAFDSEGYENEIRSMPEFACVDFQGFLDREGIVRLLSESVVGLYLLRNIGQYLKIDTFGIKVYEYMSMGLPVIMSHSDYNDRMMEKYQFGICVDPENIEEIAKAITYLLDNPQAAKQMGENGRKAVKEEFNWGVEEKKLLKLYEDLLSSDEK